MKPLLIIKTKIPLEASMGIKPINIISNINLFLFNRSPETFYPNIVQRPSSAIHTNFYPGLYQYPRKFVTRILSSLICVKHIGCSSFKSFLEHFSTKYSI